jgi:hypothetical protein
MSSINGRHAMHRVVRLGPDTGRAATADATWVSLLTVEAIPAQVKLNTWALRPEALHRAATCALPGLPSGNTAISTTEAPPAT